MKHRVCHLVFQKVHPNISHIVTTRKITFCRTYTALLNLFKVCLSTTYEPAYLKLYRNLWRHTCHWCSSRLWSCWEHIKKGYLEMLSYGVLASKLCRRVSRLMKEVNYMIHVLWNPTNWNFTQYFGKRKDYARCQVQSSNRSLCASCSKLQMERNSFPIATLAFYAARRTIRCWNRLTPES